MAKPRKSPEPEPDEAPPVEVPSLANRFGRFVLKHIFRPKRLLLLALLPIVGSIAPLIWRNWPDLDERPVYRLDVGDIRITPPPRPVPTNIVERAIGTANLDNEFSVLDESLLPRLADAFAQEPWILRVVRLRKGLPAHVEIDVEYRRPVAMIDVKSGVYPVDVHGVLLPPGDFSPAEIRRYPLVTGVSSLPSGAPGVSWGDATVIGAARIANAIGDDWITLDLIAIHAPPLATSTPELDDLTFELHTRGGSVILWGRPPGTGHPGELTADQKIGRLKRYVADFGSLAAPGAAFEIDIRPWQEITRRPLAAAESAGRERR